MILSSAFILVTGIELRCQAYLASDLWPELSVRLPLEEEDWGAKFNKTQAKTEWNYRVMMYVSLITQIMQRGYTGL